MLRDVGLPTPVSVNSISRKVAVYRADRSASLKGAAHYTNEAALLAWDLLLGVIGYSHSAIKGRRRDGLDGIRI